jgi:hypothetical protein
MKIITGLICLLVLASCTTMKLSIPDTFKKQATAWHVEGARKNKMIVGNYATSKIKRGLQLTSSGWNNSFFLENLVLSQAGFVKVEDVDKERAKFRYSISGQNSTADIFGQEKELTRSTRYHILNSKSIFNDLGQIQQYEYIFSAQIKTEGAANSGNWELAMSNAYDRKKDTVKKLFAYVPPDDRGIATNGQDTIFIKPVSIRNTEGANGKQGKLPVKMLSGYELSTADGVMAIIDLIDKSVWVYNELEEKDRFMIAVITTALFARKVNDTKW